MSPSVPAAAASAASVALLSAAAACGADPDAWAAYEAQVDAACRAAVEQEGGATVAAAGAVAHGSDPVGSFMILAGGTDDWSATWICRAPRGEGALTVELVELPPTYEVSFPAPPSGAPVEAPQDGDAPSR